MTWIWRSAREISAAVAEGRVTAREIAVAHLDRIRALDPSLGAFLLVDEQGAIEQAEEVDRRRAAGQPLGRLSGVPVAIKDNIVTRGVATTAGSRILAGWIPPYTATAVARLSDEGAVLLGKLNLDEFAMGSSTENSAYHVTRNPWSLDRVPGGSSGGAAAAVAAGLCALALGSDTGGSVRQPAALCGCVGLKPTYGRVSRHGLIAYASSLDQIGPLGRSVADCALALDVIAGEDPLDATTLAGRPSGLLDACSRGLAGLRLGLPRDLLGAGLDDEVGRLLLAALDDLAAQGVEIVDIALPHHDLSISTYYLIAAAEASSNLARYDGVRFGLRVPAGDLAATYSATRAAGFGPEVRRRILLGTFALRAGYYDAYYLRAQRVRSLIRDDFARAFERCDAIAMPTSPVPAFRLGERMGDPLSMYLADLYTLSCNLAGLPGISVPCGFTDSGLPVGLQLLCPERDESTLLRVAAGYEEISPWSGRRPPLDGGAA